MGWNAERVAMRVLHLNSDELQTLRVHSELSKSKNNTVLEHSLVKIITFWSTAGGQVKSQKLGGEPLGSPPSPCTLFPREE